MFDVGDEVGDGGMGRRCGACGRLVPWWWPWAFQWELGSSALRLVEAGTLVCEELAVLSLCSLSCGF